MWIQDVCLRLGNSARCHNFEDALVEVCALRALPFIFLILQNNLKSYEWILIKFSGNVGHGARKTGWDFGADSNSGVDPGIFLRPC